MMSTTIQAATLSDSSTIATEQTDSEQPTKPIILNQTWTSGVPMTSQPEQFPSIVSDAAVVMDMTTGTVVYAKNPLVEHYPASITKIMTAMLALQDGKLTDMIPVSKDAADQPPDKLYFVPGEEKTLEQMLYGLLLISANDAAVAIAEKYGGSVSGFADMMNQEAKTLGATHTHFDNPNGLPDPNHVTTAYDMALISQAAMQIPEFRKIVSTRYYDWYGEAWQSHLSNINHMLFNYPGCIGIKTGFTSVAHETLVTAATRGNDTFLVVLMDAPTNYQIDHDATQLLNFAFAHYQTEVISPKDQVVEQIQGAGGHSIPLYTRRQVEATVDKAHPIHLSVNVRVATLPAQAVNQDSTPIPDATNVKGSMLASGTHATAPPNSWLHVGDVSYAIPDQPLVTVPVFAPRSAFPRPKAAGVSTSHGRTWWFVIGSGFVLIALLFLWRRRRRRRRNRYSSMSNYTYRNWN